MIPVELGAHGHELETAVKALLKEHGVFTDRLHERTHQLIQKLGAQAVHHAFQSKRPWMALKDLANAAQPKFKIIQEDEFDQVVKARSANPQAVKTRKVTTGPKESRQPQVIQPSDVIVPPGVFAQEDGQSLASVTLRQLSPNAKGIVLVSEAEAQPYLSQVPMSKEGLAFLILPPVSEAVQSLGSPVRFPVQAIATSEPMLITATMVQGGQKMVGRNVPSARPQVEQVATQTVKILVYKDQFVQSWSEVTDKPIRYVLQVFPGLKVCKQSACECASWHQSDEDMVEPILDVWQRDMLTIHFKRTKTSEATLFTSMLRLTSKAFQQVAPFSGTSGVYIEARNDDGKQQDPRYHTIWLNKLTYEEARAAQTTTEVDTTLVRVTNRYGLRVLSQFAQGLHDQFRPSEPFMAGTSQETWVVGPMPWGTTRQALQKLFSSWSWNAKPLQPAGKSADQLGLKWLVRAAEPPKSYVYTLAHGDVLIVKDAANEDQAAGSPGFAIEASQKTHKAIQPGPLQWDPWAKAAFGGNTSPAKLTTKHLASMQAAVVEKVLAKLPTPSATTANSDAEMTTDHEPRFQALEAQIQQLQNDQQQLGGRMDQIGQQLETQTRSLQQTVEKQLSDQMSRLEALFRKRDRPES